jgi:hypothetical protein
MRPNYRRPLLTAALLVGACALFAGCGDEGGHLPASLNGTNAAYATAGTGGLFDEDPGALDAGVRSGVDDPVLQDVSLEDPALAGDGLATEGLATDDPWASADADWDEHEGSMATAFSNTGLDDVAFDDDLAPVGYGGYGSGYGDGWGIGSALVGAASFSNVGAFDGGFADDPGLVDPGFADPGFDDPGIADAGFMDAGFDDPGVVDAGFDGGFDPGFADPGFDAGVADAGFVDGGFDAGFDAGGFDPGVVF